MVRKRGVFVAAITSAIMVTALGVAVAAQSRAVAYCSVIPAVQVQPESWGFHGGEPITGATGSYARGHGDINLSAHTVSGIVCQVDRVPNAPDRQIVLSIDRKLVYTSHTAVMFGVPGNIMRIDVRVKTSTDPNCAVGTAGSMTIFASYNGVHEDSVEFSLPAACRDHTHRYTGPSVVTNVPPN